MRRAAIGLFTLFFVSCSSFGSLNPFDNNGGPEDSFKVAKAAYVAAFQSAAQFVTVCQSQPPTERCDRLTLKLYDDVNPRAREAIALGEGVLAGVLPPNVTCDTTTDPDCEAKLRAEQLARLAMLLQQLAITLNARSL